MENAKKVCTVMETAVQLGKSEGATRWYLAKEDCKLRIVRIGGRIYVTQASIDALLAGDLEEQSA